MHCILFGFFALNQHSHTRTHWPTSHFNDIAFMLTQSNRIFIHFASTLPFHAIALSSIYILYIHRMLLLFFFSCVFIFGFRITYLSQRLLLRLVMCVFLNVHTIIASYRITSMRVSWQYAFVVVDVKFKMCLYSIGTWFLCFFSCVCIILYTL